MNYFMPAFLLISALAGSVWAANAQAPENIRDLETAYQKFCTRRGEALLPAFSKKLLALQQQAVNQSDFEKAKQIQSVLQNIKKDILSPPSSNTIDPFFIGKAWKKNGDSNEFTQFLDAGLRRFSKDIKQTAFQPQDQWADPGKSSREIVVFTGEPLRIWVKKDDSTIIQIYKDSSTDWLPGRHRGQGHPPIRRDAAFRPEGDVPHGFRHACARYLQSQLPPPHGGYFRKTKGLGGHAVRHGTGRPSHFRKATFLFPAQKVTYGLFKQHSGAQTRRLEKNPSPGREIAGLRHPEE